MPSQHKSPSSQAASLPVLRLEEEPDLGFGNSYSSVQQFQQIELPRESPEYVRPVEDDRGLNVATSEVGVLSDSSGSSSDSSDSDSDPDNHPINSTITSNGKCICMLLLTMYK